MKTKEKWLDIKGFPGYLISNTGFIVGKRFNKTLKYQYHNGYAKVSLYQDGNQVTKVVHRLVAEHFLSKKHTEKDTVDHRDGDKSNNHVDNLQWLSRSENTIKYYNSKTKYTNGRKKIVKKSGRKAIKIMYPEYSQRSLAVMFGVSQSAIRRILNE